MVRRKHTLARARLARVRRGSEAGSRREEGFTLLELMIVVVCMPILIGAIAGGLVLVFSLQNTTSNRLADSGDAQLVSANYVQDVQSSQQLTTDANPAIGQCGPGTQLLGLEWNLNPATGVFQTVVTYAEVHTGKSYLLRRQYCASGFAAKPTAATTLSFDLPANQPAPIITPSTANAQAVLGWIPVATVTKVRFTTTEPASNYTFTLAAIPAASAPPSSAGSPIVTIANSQCGFAPTQGGTVQNGTYALTLCLVDFSALDLSQATAPKCQEIVAQVPGTGDTLSFCLSLSGNQPLFASALPTYPQAFLGNTIGGAPFYTGLGCPDSTPPVDGLGKPTPSCSKPAIYQTNTGFGPTNTITVTNIAVQTATGKPATGWHFVSVDAETTDVNESITWTSDKALSLIPNTPSSQYGNTCNNLPNWNGPSFNGPDQIVCQSGSQETSSIKTGTPMVDSLQPTTMQVGMKGAGLEGIALGLLLS